jgi:alpha/beta superfamily hydrolase
MPEERIFIKNDSLIIEGLLHRSSEERGVIICHPHPLMGGSMHNNVVEAIQEAFAAENFTTLRFNFRGVGRSTGIYDEGRGEMEDILSARGYLINKGMSNIFFAGYSFGSWVASKVMERNNNIFTDSVFVSPPNNYFDFDWAKLTDYIGLIICGDQDQFCDPEAIKKQIKEIQAKLEMISGADHFYLGKEKELINVLRKYIIE